MNRRRQTNNVMPMVGLVLAGLASPVITALFVLFAGTSF